MKKIFTKKGLMIFLMTILIAPTIIILVQVVGVSYTHNKLEEDGYYVQENRTIEPEWLIVNRKHKGYIYPQQEWFYYH